MPKLKPETQSARRENIIDAAERCFARSGFHRTTMQDICKVAGVSPGALYVYFKSKEDLIAGIVERDRAEFAEQFAHLAQAHDFFAALQALGDFYLDEARAHKSILCVEIGLESTRNAHIAEIFRRIDEETLDAFRQLFARLAAEGRIAPALDIDAVTAVFAILGDGLFWRRAVHPKFAQRETMPALMATIRQLLNPVETASKDDAP